MLYQKEIKQELEVLNSLLNLVEIYGEIASVRMMRIRGFVLKNRDFLSAINSIFQDTLASYSSKLSMLVKKGKIKKGGKITFLAHNGKTVCVLVSANTGFYGEIVPQTFRAFMSDVKKADIEATIIGRLGLSLFVSQAPKKPYTFFEFPDYGTDEAKLSEITHHLVQYEQIKVYYGKYQSVVTQKPTITEITAGTPVMENAPPPAVDYLFEPSLERILMFFETEIFASLFDQSIRESQLAKFASRIMAMDRASQNIRDKVGDVNLEMLKAVHRIVNRKQLNTLSSTYFST